MLRPGPHFWACILLTLLLLARSAEAVRYIQYTPYGGNNNVRNAFFGALQVAWLMNTQLESMNISATAGTSMGAGKSAGENMNGNGVSRKFHASVVVPTAFHGKADSMLDVFDLPAMASAGLSVVARDKVDGAVLAAAESDWTDTRCHFTNEPPATWVARLKKIFGANICKSGVQYTHLYRDGASVNDDDWQKYNIRAFYSVVRFRTSIADHGAALRKLLPTDYIAVHYRAGDKSPMPLINCSEYGLTRAALRSRACTHKHDHLRAIVSYEEVILDLWKIRPPRTVFVATPSSDDNRFVLFNKTLSAAGLTVVTLADLEGQLTAAQLQHASKANTGVRFLASWVDQYLCAQADQFLPSAMSSWTLLVIFMRRALARPGSEEWVQLFGEAYRLTGTDNPQFQYYGQSGEKDQIVPNFVTRCPAGTSVAGSFCLCNNAASECVLMPALAPPTDGKGCLQQRHFSPLTFRRSAGFWASCGACRCDPFDGLG